MVEAIEGPIHSFHWEPVEAQLKGQDQRNLDLTLFAAAMVGLVTVVGVEAAVVEDPAQDMDP